MIPDLLKSVAGVWCLHEKLRMSQEGTPSVDFVDSAKRKGKLRKAARSRFLPLLVPQELNPAKRIDLESQGR
jgi:hypothetical protein